MAATGRPDLRLISSRSPRICVRHPETREPSELPLGEFLFRIEQGLGCAVEQAWIPLLAAMADGLFMQREGILWRARAGRGLVDPSRLPDRGRLADSALDDAVAAGVVEAATVEDIYRAGRWEGLERPRTWELNGWWEALFGVIPMPPAREDDDDDEEVDPLPAIPVGKRAHPFGLQSEDNQVRQLLERGLLSQGERLFRLRVSIHEQGRALSALREGWRIEATGVLALPQGDAATRQAMALRLARMHRGARQFSTEALGQLVRLGLARRSPEGYLA